MTKTQEAAAHGKEAHLTTDEVTSSANSNYDAINILKSIHEQAAIDLFHKWKMQRVIELIQKTFDFIAGVNDDEKWSEYDLMNEWTDFSHFYSAAYYTGANYGNLEGSMYEKEDREKTVTGNEKE